MGWRSSDTVELSFDGCRIPAANLRAEQHCGFYEPATGRAFVIGVRAMLGF